MGWSGWGVVRRETPRLAFCRRIFTTAGYAFVGLGESYKITEIAFSRTRAGSAVSKPSGAQSVASPVKPGPLPTVVNIAKIA